MQRNTTDDYVGTNIIMDKGRKSSMLSDSSFTEGGAEFVNEDGSKADGYVNSDAEV